MMNIRSLARGLNYRGSVKGKRQTYHVFDNGDSYFVFSFARTKPNAGYFNVVSADTVDAIHERFAGSRGITANEVVSAFKRSKHVKDRFQALNGLYALAATDRAKVDSRKQTPQLFFNVHAS